MRRSLLGGILLAVLWFVLGWASFALQRLDGRLATLGQLLPSPLRYGVFGTPIGWAVVVQVLMAVALIAAFVAFATWLAPPGRGTFAAGWLAAILSAFLIGASLDLGSFAVWVGQFGFRGGLGTMGAAPLAAWWAVVVGWVPALVVRRRRGQTDAEPNGATDAAPRARTAATATVAAVIAVAAMIAFRSRLRLATPPSRSSCVIPPLSPAPTPKAPPRRIRRRRVSPSRPRHRGPRPLPRAPAPPRTRRSWLRNRMPRPVTGSSRCSSSTPPTSRVSSTGTPTSPSAIRTATSST